MLPSGKLNTNILWRCCAVSVPILTPQAPAADVESGSLERCTTAPSSGVALKTQPLVSSSPSVRSTAAADAAASPAPQQAEEDDDVDYDSDDSSKIQMTYFGNISYSMLIYVMYQ